MISLSKKTGHTHLDIFTCTGVTSKQQNVKLTKQQSLSDADKKFPCIVSMVTPAFLRKVLYKLVYLREKEKKACLLMKILRRLYRLLFFYRSFSLVIVLQTFLSPFKETNQIPSFTLGLHNYICLSPAASAI